MSNLFCEWKILETFYKEALIKSGVPKEDAKIYANIQIDEIKKGEDEYKKIKEINSFILEKLKNGDQKVKTDLKIIRDIGIKTEVESNELMEPVICYKAMQKAILKSKEYGAGIVIMKNLSSLGRPEYFSEMAAKEGCIGLVGTISKNLLPYPTEKMFGNNPIVISIPTDGEESLIINSNILPVDKSKYVPLGQIYELIESYYHYGFESLEPILDKKDSKSKSKIQGAFFMSIEIDQFCGKEKYLKLVGEFLRKIKEKKNSGEFSKILLANQKEYSLWKIQKAKGFTLSLPLSYDLDEIKNELKLNIDLPWNKTGILIYNGRVATLGCEKLEYYENGYVRINAEGIITDVGKEPHPKPEKEEREFNANGNLIFPGFVCGHGHFYGLYSRGLNLLDEPAKGFLEVLERLWWRLDRALDNEDSNYYSALIYTLEGLRAGTTTIIDHHASPYFIKGSLDQLERATKDCGIRCCLCYEVTDRNGMDGANQGIDENVRYMRKIASNKDDMMGACFGLHAPFTLCDQTLNRCRTEIEKIKKDFPDFKAGFHVHVAEGKYDEDYSMEHYGMSCIERLEKIGGILGENTIVGHGVFLNDKELDILAKTKTNIMTNPESNMNNAVGVPNIAKMISKGITVGLGTDGMTYDMLQEYRTSCLLHKLNNHDPRVGTMDTFNMLFRNNSVIASKFFNHPVGRLEKGAFGDVVIIEYKNPTVLSKDNLPWQLHFGVSTNGVRNVFVGGREIYKDGESTLINEEAEYKYSREKVTPYVTEQFRKIVEKEKKKSK